MHVNARKIALSGVLAAFAVVLIVLGSIFETSTLFLLAAAAFCVGIVVREWGIAYGAAFLTACTLLGVIVSPQKMYCVTFAAMGIYLLLAEAGWEALAKAEHIQKKKIILWVWKYLVFNSMFLPALYFFPSLLVAKKMTKTLFFVMAAAGQAGILIFDRAYIYFQAEVWGRLRGKVMKQ